MYQYYEITLEGNDKVVLTYKLESHRPAQVWAGLINSTPVESLRKSLFPWQDFDKAVLPARVTRLEELIDELNQWLPAANSIPGKWNHASHRESVARLHVHFPEQEKTETDPGRRAQLNEYNDLIHEITGIVDRPNARPSLLLCPDATDRIPLEGDDFKLFRTRRFFGELCLHYCHVGRHPFELFMDRDFNCPEDQIIPQRDISAYHTLHFCHDEYLDHWHRAKFFAFYEVSTIKNVIERDDPRMAFGYIPLGRLITDKKEAEVLNMVGSCNRVVGWRTF